MDASLISQRLPEETLDSDVVRMPGREPYLEVTWRIVNRQHVIHLYNKENGGYCYGEYCGADSTAAAGAFYKKMRTWGPRP